jgi:hypothetical protein
MGQATPLQALRQAAASLAPPYEVTDSDASHVALDTSDVALPALTLRLQKERRLFSRTFALVVEASAPGDRPEGDASALLRWKGLRRRPALVAGDPAGEAWVDRLEGSGLLEGVRTMTNVESLEARWDATRGLAVLRMTTLAGALIGTTPGSAVAVPLEPDDVEGLLRILRGLARAAGPSGP